MDHTKIACDANKLSQQNLKLC